MDARFPRKTPVTLRRADMEDVRPSFILQHMRAASSEPPGGSFLRLTEERPYRKWLLAPGPGDA